MANSKREEGRERGEIKKGRLALEPVALVLFIT